MCMKIKVLFVVFTVPRKVSPEVLKKKINPSVSRKRNEKKKYDLIKPKN